MKKEIAVCLTDTIYGLRFVQYLKQKETFDYQITYFSQLDALTHYLTSHQVEILVLLECTIVELSSTEKCKTVVYLTEDEFTEVNQIYIDPVTLIQSIKIYQFQSIEQMLKILKEKHILKNSDESRMYTTNRQNIISLLALENLTCVEKIVRGITQLKKQNSRILFLNLSQFSYFEENKEDILFLCLSDMIYEIKENEMSQERFCEYIFHSKYFDYIKPVCHGLDILELQVEDIKQIFYLAKVSGYDTVIVSTQIISNAILEVFNCSQWIMYLHNEEVPNKLEESVRRQLDQVLATQQMDLFRQIIVSDDSKESKILTELSEIVGDLF